MSDYHKHTCIRFKPYTGEESDYIRITAGNTGCWSSVGKVGGVQDVNLQVPGCVTKKGTIIHELMHSIGFLHEQSRYERDQFVNIQWKNIMPGTFCFLLITRYIDQILDSNELQYINVLLHRETFIEIQEKIHQTRSHE